MKTFFGRKKAGLYGICLLLLLTGLLCGCGKTGDVEEGKGRNGKKTSVTPTGEITPTGEVTPTGEPTPTGEITPTPTEIPGISVKESDLYGVWYAHTLEALEVGIINCKDDPSNDYRLDIEGGYLVYSTTRNHNPGTEYGSKARFKLRTSFTDAERETYQKMGYGMETYLDEPTDPSKGHFVYSCMEGSDKDALFIIDVAADGALHTLYAFVADGGSFPVFTDGVYRREPVYPMGTYYEDYLGIWHCQSHATLYEEGFDVSDEEPLDLRLWFKEGGQLLVTNTYGDDRDQIETFPFQFREDFTDEELDMYRKWDEAGIRVWGQQTEGELFDIAERGSNLSEGRAVFVGTGTNNAGQLISVSWSEEFQCMGLLWGTFDTAANREYGTYFTFKRENPYSYEKGTCYTDYIGTYAVTEIRYPGSDETKLIDDENSYPKLWVNPDGTVSELYADRTVTYSLRTYPYPLDPEWYKNYNLENYVTDLSAKRLVYVSDDENFYPRAVLVLEYQKDGVLTASYYGNSGGNMSVIPYKKYVRETGISR